MTNLHYEDVHCMLKAVLNDFMAHIHSVLLNNSVADIYIVSWYNRCPVTKKVYQAFAKSTSQMAGHIYVYYADIKTIWKKKYNFFFRNLLVRYFYFNLSIRKFSEVRLFYCPYSKYVYMHLKEYSTTSQIPMWIRLSIFAMRFEL